MVMAFFDMNMKSLLRSFSKRLHLQRAWDTAYLHDDLGHIVIESMKCSSDHFLQSDPFIRTFDSKFRRDTDASA